VLQNLFVKGGCMTCCSISVRSESFSSLSDGWEAVIAAGSGATVFDLPLWQRTWWDHFGEGKEQQILSVRGDDGSLEMVAPMMREGNVVSFLGGTDLVDYHDFICPTDASQSCLEAVIRELSADSDVRTLLFESISESSATLKRLPLATQAAGWEVAVQKEDVAPKLELPGEWEQYVSGLRKKDRHELRRKIRRLEAAGDVRQVELTTREDVETAASDFFRLHRMSTPEKNEFMTQERERFFRDVMARLADADITRLTFLELDGKRVATSLSFVSGGVRYLYNSGYDPEYRTLAVGLLNHAYTIRRSIEQGHSMFDFMRGNEGYKYHLGGMDRDVFRITATR
jgi:CelD/BcsL family acetyltransferase involved in cellulose biosynthesis